MVSPPYCQPHMVSPPYCQPPILSAPYGQPPILSAPYGQPPILSAPHTVSPIWSAPHTVSPPILSAPYGQPPILSAPIAQPTTGSCVPWRQIGDSPSWETLYFASPPQEMPCPPPTPEDARLPSSFLFMSRHSQQKPWLELQMAATIIRGRDIWEKRLLFLPSRKCTASRSA